jgi:large subunit ribosomal protein L6
MSRIGRAPIPVPSGVEVTIEPELVASTARRARCRSGSRATSPSPARRTASSSRARPTAASIARCTDWSRTLVANMVIGVTDGYEKRLEIQGVGYRAQLKGRDLELALGFSHPVSIPAPEGIEFEVLQPTRVVVRGISKQQVGEVAATSASSARRSPTRARGSATRARSSPARSASAHEEQAMAVLTKEARRLKRRRRVRAKVSAPPRVRACPSSAPTAASPRS